MIIAISLRLINNSAVQKKNIYQCLKLFRKCVKQYINYKSSCFKYLPITIKTL